MLYSPVKANQYLEKHNKQSSACCLIHAGLLVDLVFNPENLINIYT
jgi:hypothetical protein